MQMCTTRNAVMMLAALALSATAASAIPVAAKNLRPLTYLSLPNRSDLLNPNGSVKGTSPYLAGVGGTAPYTGVGTLYIKSDNSGAGAFLCTGSLISPTIVLTAAHCVSNPEIGHLKQVIFAVPNGRPIYGASPAPNPGPVEFAVGGAYATLPDWDINTLSNDMAVVRLDTPITGTEIYDIYRGNPLGEQFSIVGTGTGGWGDVGADSETGYLGGLFDLRKRVGENIFEEYAKPFFQAILDHFGLDFGVTGPDDGMLLYDFDSGLAQSDVFGQLCSFADPELTALCVTQTGVAKEVSSAPGDSGGPLFVGNQIAGITSWGLTGAILTFDGTYIYCAGSGDIDVSYSVDTGSCTDSSFGEIDGVTNVAAYQDFVDASLAGDMAFALVPEPASLTLLLGGLAGLGSLRRRRR